MTLEINDPTCMVMTEHLVIFGIFRVTADGDLYFPARAPHLTSNKAMYWPLGAPKVYAATRRKRKPPSPEYEEDDSEDVEEKNANILSLRVARNGHLFVTITQTTLTVWQTSVSGDRRSFD